MKRKLISSVVLAAAFVAQSFSAASACDRGGVRYYRRAAVPAVNTVAVVREQQIVVVERAPEVVQVAAAMPPAEAVGVPSGSLVRVTGFFGREQGSVFLTVDKVIVECKVANWSAGQVSFVLPDLGLLEAAPAVVDIARIDGQIAKRNRIVLTAKPDLEVVVPELAGAQPAAKELAAGQVETGGLSPSTQDGLSVAPASLTR